MFIWREQFAELFLRSMMTTKHTKRTKKHSWREVCSVMYVTI